MGMPADWNLTMKRKDGLSVKDDALQVAMVIAHDYDNEIDYDFYPEDYSELEYGSSFSSESISASERLDACLADLSKLFPQLVFRLEWKGETDGFSATIYDNGDKEDLEGRITYDEPKRLKY